MTARETILAVARRHWRADRDHPSVAGPVLREVLETVAAEKDAER